MQCLFDLLIGAPTEAISRVASVLPPPDDLPAMAIRVYEAERIVLHIAVEIECLRIGAGS